MGTWESWERIFFSKNVDLAKQRINEALFERLDVNLIGERTGFSALMLAVAFKHDDRLEIVKRLLARGAKVNLQCSKRKVTALHVAAQKGALDCVTLLLKYEADPSLLDSEGQTPGEVAYSILIDEPNRVRQEIQEQCYSRLKHAREDWIGKKRMKANATPEFRRNVLNSVYRGAVAKRAPSPEIPSTEAVHGSSEETEKSKLDSPEKIRKARTPSGSAKRNLLRSTNRESPHKLFINRPGLGKLEIINTPRKVVLEDNLFPSPRAATPKMRHPSSGQHPKSDGADLLSPRVTPKPIEKSSEAVTKTEALEITALPRPKLSPRAFVYPSPEKCPKLPLKERSSNKDESECSEDNSKCLFNDSNKSIENTQHEKENQCSDETPRSFREFATQTPPFLSPVAAEPICTVPPVTVTPIVPSPSSGSSLKRQNEFHLRARPALKLPVAKSPEVPVSKISPKSNKDPKDKSDPDKTSISSSAKKTLPKFPGSITETSLFEYFEKSFVLPKYSASEEADDEVLPGSNRPEAKSPTSRELEVMEDTDVNKDSQVEIKEVDVSSDYHNNETFVLQKNDSINEEKSNNADANAISNNDSSQERNVNSRRSSCASSFTFPAPPDFIQSIVVHPSPEKRTTPKKRSSGGSVDASGLAAVLFEKQSAPPSMMPGSIIDLVNLPSEHPPASLMPPVVIEEEQAANLTTSDGAQSFHLEFSFSSAGTAENSIEIMEDGKSIARKVENLSATEESPNLNLSSGSGIEKMDDTKLRNELRKFKVCVPPCITDAARCRFRTKLRKMRDVGVEFSAELIDAIHGVDIRGPPTGQNNLRVKVSNESRTPGKDPQRFFNYLLLDPRKTNNLTRRYQENANLSSVEILKCFMKSIFYVGKGTHARTHAHIKEAMNFSSKKPGYKMKLKTIQDIFATPRPNVQPNEEQNFGLLICEFSKNVSNTQALNQEAAMIEALNIDNLANYKREKFSLRGWKDDEIRQLGSDLLCGACRMYLCENEHFIYPSHV